MSRATLEQKVQRKVYIAHSKGGRLCGHQHIEKLSAYRCGFQQFGDDFAAVESLSPTQRRRVADATSH